MHRKITHLYTRNNDYTLCGFGYEELDDFGIPNKNESNFKYKEIVKRMKYNTNCKSCQKIVENILSQIKK